MRSIINIDWRVRGCSVIFIVMSFNILNAQKMSLNKDTFTIGDAVVLSILPSTNVDQQALSIDFGRIKNLEYEHDTTYLEKYADIELNANQEGNIKVSDKKYLITSYTKPIDIGFNIFTAGSFYISNGIDSVLLNVLPPNISNQKNPTEIKDIKPIIEDNSTDWESIIIYTLGALLLLGLLYYLYKKYKKYKESKVALNVVNKKEKVLSPAEQALKALQNLLDNQLYETEDVKEFQTQLTNIIRQYTASYYGVKSFEMTTTELLDTLQSLGEKEDNLDALQKIYSLADIAKFAKAKPSAELCKTAVEKAIYYIKTSKKI